jgi:hypothetical protein
VGFGGCAQVQLEAAGRGLQAHQLVFQMQRPLKPWAEQLAVLWKVAQGITATMQRLLEGGNSSAMES